VTLQRIAYPSPNYSSRWDVPRLIVLHTAEGARDIASLGAWFGNPANEVSSHVGIDDTPNTVGEYVLAPDGAAWTQAEYNGVAVSAELCGFAAWTAADWTVHDAMITNAGLWVGEEAARFGIPLTILTAAQAQSGGAGVCQHIDLGAGGGGHVDCDYGSGNFPIGRVLEIAGGAPVAPGPGPTPPPAAGVAPPWPGVVLVDFTSGHGTATWQAQMAARGWRIDVDDMYGPASAAVCRDFQAEALAEGHDIGAPAPDAAVGPRTWDLAWTKPVT